MGVYIKGMEMQDSCYECPINKDDGFGYFTCGVTKNECDFRKLPCDCPLIPVPDHGELVDRQELLKEQLPLMDGGFRVAAVRVMNICSAKVFIPADKENNNG